MSHLCISLSQTSVAEAALEVTEGSEAVVAEVAAASVEKWVEGQ